MLKSFASGLHEEWSKPVDECIGLEATAENQSWMPLRRQPCAIREAVVRHIEETVVVTHSRDPDRKG